jgi:hypothetical protein
MSKPRTNLATPQSPSSRDRWAASSPYAAINPTRRNHQKRGLRVVDGRGPEAAFLRRVTKHLVEHIGIDRITIPQRALISKIAWIELRCTMLDRKLIDSRETPYDVDTYLAHAKALKLLYQALGLNRPTKSFAELMQK